jgi:DNA-binding CsgD family transcriptional regulator
MAGLWFALTAVTSLVRTEGGSARVFPFVASSVVLFALLFAYVLHARRISTYDAARAVVPVFVAGLLALVVLAEKGASAAFLVLRTVAMFFWAIVWIESVQAVRSGRGTATGVTGRVRGAIQGGAVLALPVGLFVGPDDLGLLATVCVVVVVVLFALAVPSSVPVAERVTETSARRLGSSGSGAAGRTAAEAAAAPESSGAFDPFDARCAAFAGELGLSPREAEVASCMLRGRNLPYIRESLCISRNTINTHIRHIYQKAGVHSRQELIDLFETAGRAPEPR